MPLFLELRDGHPSLDESSNVPGTLGPVIGPFLAVRILRDEVRVTTAEREFPLLKVADWVYYGGRWFSDIEIVPAEQMDPSRTRRRCKFEPEQTEPAEQIAA